LFGGIWIYSTDTLLAMTPLPKALLIRFSIDKGLLYILVTSVLLFFLMQKAMYERSVTEKELELSEERFKKIVEESPTAIHLYRLNKYDQLILVGANSVANKTLSIDHGPLIGLPLEDAFPGLEGTGIPDLCKKVARGEVGVQSFEMPYSDKRFSGFYDIHAFRIGQDNIVVDFEDISERKKMEEAHNLAQLGEMISGIAHEVRNPLAIISGKAELTLSEKPLDPAVADNLSLIIKECQRAGNMIGRLLKFARPSSNNMREVFINEVINNSVRMVEDQYMLKNVKIITRPGRELPNIKADERQIREILINLMNNSFEAMPDGGTITTFPYIDDGYLRVDIADTGKGISEETMSRIFEPFFSTKENGTGLGLLICKSILMQYGGKITAKSESGKGAVFSIYFPLKEKVLDA
jgi:two-component system, cell cycle sensor histidine kinase and response regulator CckA